MDCYEKQFYKPRTLCEVCENACGGCSWSEKGVQQPVEGWDAIPTVIDNSNDAKHGRQNGLLVESYIVLRCPEFKLEERNRWAFERFDPLRELLRYKMREGGVDVALTD